MITAASTTAPTVQPHLPTLLPTSPPTPPTPPTQKLLEMTSDKRRTDKKEQRQFIKANTPKKSHKPSKNLDKAAMRDDNGTR